MIEEIEKIDQGLERPASSAEEDKIAKLESARERAEEISVRLQVQIQELVREKQELEIKQEILKSGLIGALVTALVAIIGAFSNFRRSKADRDLRRLEVVEKAYELAAKGLDLPNDIRMTYGLHSTGHSIQSPSSQIVAEEAS